MIVAEDLFKYQILETRVVDLEMSKTQMETKLDQILMNYSKLYAEHEKRNNEIMDLKQVIDELKKKKNINDEIDVLSRKVDKL